MIHIKSLLIILLTCLAPALKAEERPFYFIQMSDPQFGMYADNEKGSGFAKETANMEKAIAAINKLSPAFIVITGDLVENLTDKQQLAEYQRLKEKIRKDIPVYQLPGNHDLGNEAKEENVKLYLERYGYDCFSFTIYNCCFIGINTQVLYGDNRPREWQQRIWLQHILENAKQCNDRIVFGHYPLFEKDFEEPDKYQNIPIAMRSLHLDIFDRYGVSHMFSGHLHYPSEGTYKNFHAVGTGAVGFPIGENTKSGLRIVKVYPDHIESEFVELDKIPTDIKL